MNAPKSPATLPAMPAQPTTKQLPSVAVPTSQMDALLTELRLLRGDVAVCIDQGHTTGKAVGELGDRVGKLEARADGGSMRAKADTLTNEQQDSRLDSLDAKVDRIEQKVDVVHASVVGFFRNPKVIFVGKVLFAAAVAYSGLHGLKVLP